MAATKRFASRETSSCPVKEALIRKEGDCLIMEPVTPPRLLAVLATLDPIDETFPDIQDPAPEPVTL